MDPQIEHKDRILVVEDEEDIRKTLEFAIRNGGYDVRLADRGEVALQELDRFAPDLVLLDLMLPDMSGLEICRNLRERKDRKQPAVIILSARSEELDRVVGFELGADDYVPKPFSMRELLLRIDARLKARRGMGGPGQGADLTLGDLRVDEAAHRVFVGEEEIHLSSTEMRFLVYLLRAPSRMCTRKQVLTEVWGYHPEVTSRTVDTHIKRIRDKLGRAADLVQTVRGVGFRLALPRDRNSSA
jgi:two-component system phosphate regulon response regulator PhoB